MRGLELALTQTHRIHFSDALGHLRHTVLLRIDDDDALVGVHQQNVVGLNHFAGVAYVDQRWDFERTCQNGGVRRCRALFDDQARDGYVLTALQNQNVGRTEIFGHQNDRALAHHARDGVGRATATAQNALHALDHLRDVVNAVGQIVIVDFFEATANVL